MLFSYIKNPFVPDLRTLKKVCMLIFAKDSGSSLVAIINSKINLSLT
jgi:hypothetical protein